MTHEHLFQLSFGLETPQIISTKRLPHPRPDPRTQITPRDIFYNRMDRHFQGRVNEWVESQTAKHNFSIKEVLPDLNLKIFSLFFYPQPDGNWLTQSQALGNKNTSRFNNLMRESLARIYRRILYGHHAMEILRPQGHLYLRLIFYNKNLIGDLMSSDPDEFIKICGSRNIFEALVSQIQKQEPKWQPPVFLFPSEAIAPQPVRR